MHHSFAIKSVWLIGAFTVAAIVGSWSTRSELENRTELTRVGESNSPVQESANEQEKPLDPSDQKHQSKKNPESLAKPPIAHAPFVHDRKMGKQECVACHRVDPKQPLHASAHLLGVGESSDLETDKQIDTAFLGLHASEVPAALRKHLKLKHQQGAIVETVIDESPAYHCGIEIHDVVVAIDSQPVLGEKSLLEKVRSKKPGTKILVEYIRHGQKESCNVVLGKQRTAQILNSFRIKGCPAQLTSTTNCRDCHSSASR